MLIRPTLQLFRDYRISGCIPGCVLLQYLVLGGILNGSKKSEGGVELLGSHDVPTRIMDTTLGVDELLHPVAMLDLPHLDLFDLRSEMTVLGVSKVVYVTIHELETDVVNVYLDHHILVSRSVRS